MMRRPLDMALVFALAFPVLLYPLFPSFQWDLGFQVGGGEAQWVVKASRLVFILNYVLVFAVASAGLNVQTGFAGQLNLGLAGFMAVGAYTAAILQISFRDWFMLHDLIGIPILALSAIVASALVGGLVCLPTLRLRGDYFAIVTFGFAELVRQVIKNETWTRGSGGINNLFLLSESSLASLETALAHVFPQISAGSFQVSFWVKGLVFTLFLAATLYGVGCLRRSRWGHALVAMRENSVAAESCGISLLKAKALSFGVTAGLAGLSGYMFVMLVETAHPSHFTFMVSVYVLCAVVLGGMGNIRGVLLGTVVLMSLGEFLRDLIDALPPDMDSGEPLVPAQARIILFGLILLVMMRFKPEGLLPEVLARRGAGK
ncbi:MAG: branched-chain amino acid ABC transporter permease [Planctomycetota bacterium]